MATEFKVGDKVRVIDADGCPEARLGDIGTITNIDYRICRAVHFLQVDRDVDGQPIGAFAYRFEHVNQTNQQETEMKSLQQQIRDTQEQLTTLQQALAESEKPKPWPQEGDEYFTITSYGSVESVVFTNTNSFAQRRKALGSIYRTKEEARAAADKQYIRTTVLAAIRELNDGWEATAEHPQRKYFLYYYSEHGEMEVTWNNHIVTRSLDYYLETQEKAEKLIEMFTTDELKQALL